jgi:hypothetical protein
MIAEDVPVDSPARKLTAEERAAWYARGRWLEQARPAQLLPPGDWDTAVWIAGRFFGKTRVIVEASWWEAWRQPNIRVHALAPTLGDVRRTLFEGESGFLAKMPPEIVESHNKTDKEIRLKNGSMIAGFSVVEEADRLRGPQCHHLLFDEAAAADRPAGNLEAAWRVAALGCRLICPDGSPSLKLIATTPRPIPFLKRLIKSPRVRLIQGNSRENYKNVAQAALNEVLSLEGTMYGKQEIDGLFIDEEDIGILKRSWFRLWPADKKLPEFSFILECYDTATSEENFDVKKQTTDPSASIVLGVFNVNQCFDEKERKRLGLRHKYAAVLCEAWTERLGFPELLDKARVQHRVKWGRPGRRADMVLIEDKSSGAPLRQTLATYGVPCWPYNPGRMNKTMRMHAASPFVKQGAIFVPESGMPERAGLPRDWVEPFLEQVCGFTGKGSTEHDDFCLAAGTRVLMADGSQRVIEDVCMGDMVATPRGPCRVSASGTTGEREIWELRCAGNLLRGTDNHPVFQSGAWIPLSHIVNTRYLVIASQLPQGSSWYFSQQVGSGLKRLSSMVGGTTGIQIQRRRFTETIFRAPAIFFTGMFGSSTTDRYRQAITSTISAGSATIFRISNVFRARSILPNTPMSDRPAARAPEASNILSGSGRRHLTGTNQKRVGNGILKTLSGLVQASGSAPGRARSSQSGNVLNAAPTWNAATCGNSSVQKLAMRNARTASEPSGGENCQSNPGRNPLSVLRNALSAALTWFRPAAASSPARRNASWRETIALPESVTRTGAIETVYNLTVEGASCFYAEGILVHNCDVLSSAVAYLRDRDMLHATPDEKYLDLEEKKEAEEQEALRLHNRERPRVNPYA